MDDFNGRGDDAQVALLAVELIIESLDLAEVAQRPPASVTPAGVRDARLRLERLNVRLELVHLLLEDALRLVVLEVRIVQGALLVVLGTHAHGAMLGDDGARVAVYAREGELLVVLVALVATSPCARGTR